MALNTEFEQHFQQLVLERGLCEEAAVDEAIQKQEQSDPEAAIPGLPELLVGLGAITASQAARLREEIIADIGEVPEIPGYRLTSFIRRIGLVQVYRGHQQSVDRSVELRILTKTSSNDAPGLAQFQREARLIAGLSHRNISGAIDMGETPNHIYLVLHHYRGKRLSEVLQKLRVLPAAALQSYARDLSDALAYLHGKGLAHGKIAPENVIITSEGQAILTGFDLIAENGLYHPGEGDNRPYYHVEELERLTSQAADFFCLGCLLFEAATGRDPLTTPEMAGAQSGQESEGGDEDTGEAAHTLPERSALPVATRYNFRVGLRMSAVIYSLLDLSPERCYKVAALLLQDVELLCNGQEPIHARKLPGIWGRRVPVLRVWPATRRGRVAFWLSGAVCGLLLGAGGALLLNRDLFITPQVSAEILAQEHWLEPVKLGDTVDPARQLWLEAEKNSLGDEKQRELARAQYTQLMQDFPAHAYARAAPLRLKQLQK